MKPRRRWLLTVCATLAGRAAPLRAQAAVGQLRRVGVLVSSTREKEAITLKPFFDQMRELGCIEGQNVAYDWACADDQMAMCPGVPPSRVNLKAAKALGVTIPRSMLQRADRMIE